jgi:hypothetical protein
MLHGADRNLPDDVRFLHRSSRGLCLVDSVLAQRSPSPWSVASVPVCYLSCHVFAIANRHFSQQSAYPRLRLFRCATCPAISLLSLTVVSHSHRRPRIPLPCHMRLCRRGRCICLSWGSFWFEGRGGLVAFHRWMGPGGAQVDFWVFLVASHRWIGPGGAEVDFWVFFWLLSTGGWAPVVMG